MKTVSAFERLSMPAGTVTFTLDGQPVRAMAGDSLAAALLAAGAGPFRTTPVTGAARAPWCMMGACYDCLVAVDGVTVQACMTAVREGMAVRRLDRVADLVAGDD